MKDFLDELVIPLLSSLVICFYVAVMAILVNTGRLP